MLVITIDTPRMGKLDPAEYNKYALPADCEGVDELPMHVIRSCSRLST